MNHVGDFMGVPVYSDPSMPKNQVLIINDNVRVSFPKTFKATVGLKLKKRVNWPSIAFWAFIVLVTAATFCIWMWALVWSWA